MSQQKKDLKVAARWGRKARKIATFAPAFGERWSAHPDGDFHTRTLKGRALRRAATRFVGERVAAGLRGWPQGKQRSL